MSRSSSISARARGLRLACRRGSVAVELGLILGLFLILLLSTFEVGRYLATRASFDNVVAEVARAAMVDTALQGCDAPKTFAVNRSGILARTLLSVCVTRAADASTLQVVASYNFSFMVAVFGAPARTLSSTITHPI